MDDDERVLEDGVTRRVTEDGEIRITEARDRVAAAVEALVSLSDLPEAPQVLLEEERLVTVGGREYRVVTRVAVSRA